MEINNNKMVSLTYELREGSSNGEVVQKVEKSEPFSFLHGGGYMLPAFEEKLVGKKTGESYEFTLTSEEGYGPEIAEMIVDLPISIFEVDGKVDEELVKVGNFIPMQNDNGQPMQGKVKEVTSDSVSMDFNHPLAGKSLYFSGEILEVREATADELEEANQMCGTGSCDTGGCGSGCGCH